MVQSQLDQKTFLLSFFLSHPLLSFLPFIFVPFPFFRLFLLHPNPPPPIPHTHNPFLSSGANLTKYILIWTNQLGLPQSLFTVFKSEKMKWDQQKKPSNQTVQCYLLYWKVDNRWVLLNKEYILGKPLFHTGEKEQKH